MNPDMNPFDDLDPEAWAELERFLPDGAAESLPDLEDYGLPTDPDEIDPNDPEQLEQFLQFMEDAVPQIVKVMQQLRINLEQHNAALEDERGPSDSAEAARFDRLFE